MDFTVTISSRISTVRKKLRRQTVCKPADEAKGNVSSVLVSPPSLLWPDTISDPLVAEIRKTDTHLQTLLYLYDRSGLEWSKSFQGERLVQRSYPRQGVLHKHDYIEILYVISGAFTQIILGEPHTFEKGSFVITDCNSEHADYIEKKNAAVLFLQIDVEYMDQILKSYDKKDELQRFLFHALAKQKKEESILVLKPGKTDTGNSLDHTVSDYIDHLLELIVEEDLSRQSSYLQVEEGYLRRLLQIMCLYFTPTRYSSYAKKREKDVLYEMERYIRANLSTVTVKDLEEQFHYHRNFYSSLLQKYRGQNFREYVQILRMQYAKSLLEETGLPIKQISLQTGYENTSFFYRLFKQTYGVSPAALRDAGRTDAK